MPTRTSAATWYLVANTAMAHLFERLDGHSPAHHLWSDEEELARKPPRLYESDRHGHAHDNFGQGRPPMDRPQDPETHIADERARDLARKLIKGRTDGAFERLVLVAAPDMLGHLRDQLDEPTRQLVAATVDKNLAERTPANITPELDRIDEVDHDGHPRRHVPRRQQESP